MTLTSFDKPFKDSRFSYRTGQHHRAAPALPPDTALAQQPVPVIAPTEIANSQEIQEPVSAPQEMEAARPEASLPENEQAQESYVAQEKAALENRQYVYYEVKPGDDLAEIAKRFHVRVETIVHLNYLGNQNLSAGTYLRLPDMGIPTEE